MNHRTLLARAAVLGIGLLLGGCGGRDLVGTWRQETASAADYRETVLDLRPDGSYTKKLTFRTPAYSGGSVGSGPTGGGTHNGTWTANGRVIVLSGDGNWPASSHDLAEFQRIH